MSFSLSPGMISPDISVPVMPFRAPIGAISAAELRLNGVKAPATQIVRSTALANRPADEFIVSSIRRLSSLVAGVADPARSHAAPVFTGRH
jgi:hypothetical protein